MYFSNTYPSALQYLIWHSCKLNSEGQWSNIKSIHYICTDWRPLTLQYDEYFLLWTNWWKHIKSSNLHVPQRRPSIERTTCTCVELHSHFRFDELFTRLTMEPFAEKPILWPLFHVVRTKLEACLGVRHTIQFNSSRSRNCRNRPPIIYAML